MKLKYNLKLPTSVYAATEIGKRLYVGGSDWNRRKTRYTKEIARKAKGILHIFQKGKAGFIEEKKVFFPSMVYSVLQLPNKKLFVGCKSGKGTLNIVGMDGRIIKQKDDEIGKGVYSSVFNTKKNEIILTTRAGKLKIIDARTLKLKAKLQLSKPKTRLWSLKLDMKKQIIYAGDYDGVLYVVDRKKHVKKFDLKTLYKGHARLKKGFGPSLWGLELLNNKIVLGTRWGDVIILNKNLGVEKQIKFKEDITCIKKFSKQTVLIGTRYGKLYLLNLKNYKQVKIKEIKPVLQKENAIWDMTCVKNEVLVCFADGNVCKVS